MRLPHGILPALSRVTFLPINQLSDYASGRTRPGSKRALELEAACKKIGLDVSIRLWLFGTGDEIKAALSRNHIKPPVKPKGNNNKWRKLLPWIN